MAAIAKSPLTSPTLVDNCIAGVVKEYTWNWQGKPLSIVYESVGQGTPVLLLPAFSTVSTRAEMGGLAELLAPQFQVVAVDWPGFGQSSRLPLDYQPALYHQFLHDFVTSIFDTPVAVVAAGHAAGYVMQLAATQRSARQFAGAEVPSGSGGGSGCFEQAQPSLFSQIVLVAPTWRGPLPTMMGKQQSWFGTVRAVVRSPLLGQALYKLNTTRSFLSMMYRSHVYGDPAKVTPEFVATRRRTTQKPGARFAPVAFVTGAIDPVQNQADFQAWFQPLPVPILVVIGEQCPPKSRAEMDALADLPGVQTQVLPGALGLHEENPAAVAQVVLPFLAK